MYPFRPRMRADCGVAARYLSLRLWKICLLCRRPRTIFHCGKKPTIWTLMSWRNPCRRFGLSRRVWRETAPRHRRSLSERGLRNELRLMRTSWILLLHLPRENDRQSKRGHRQFRRDAVAISLLQYLSKTRQGIP